MNGGELLDAPLDVARLELGQGKERKGFGGGRTFTLVGWGTTERHEQSSFFTCGSRSTCCNFLNLNLNLNLNLLQEK